MSLQKILKNLVLVFILLNISGQILAKNRINISAENVITDTVYNTAEHNSHQSYLKVGMFARGISPIIDLVNSVEKSVKDKEASDRVKAAQFLGLAAQGYTLKDTAERALNHDDKAVLFRVETGTGLSHSRQNQRGASQESVSNILNAKQIEIEARGGKLSATHTDFTARDSEGKRIADSEISLTAKQGIELQAGESHYKNLAKNQSYGTEVGTAFSVGGKTGWSFYAKEGVSKGKQESEGKTYQNSHLDAETINLNSDSDVLLKGATATAKTINADIKGDLKIESLQDEHKQKSNQIGLGTQVEFGFTTGWEFKGNANASGGSGNSK
ncbi:Filamentous hemagglutinin [Pasteurella multocida]|nr:Filamentous hemagglutinin [Pasteurella multocida]